MTLICLFFLSTKLLLGFVTCLPTNSLILLLLWGPYIWRLSVICLCYFFSFRCDYMLFYCIWGFKSIGNRDWRWHSFGEAIAEGIFWCFARCCEWWGAFIIYFSSEQLGVCTGLISPCCNFSCLIFMKQICLSLSDLYLKKEENLISYFLVQ